MVNLPLFEHYEHDKTSKHRTSQSKTSIKTDRDTTDVPSTVNLVFLSWKISIFIRLSQELMDVC